MLPLLLIFDVPENSLTANMNAIDEIMHSLEVIIQIRNKPKQNVVSVTIKGLEKNASKYLYFMSPVILFSKHVFYLCGSVFNKRLVFTESLISLPCQRTSDQCYCSDKFSVVPSS